MVSDAEVDGADKSLWKIPGWYRRVGLASWFLVGIAIAVTLIAVIIGATSEIVAPLILGAFLAIVFLPAVDWLADRGLSRILASFAVLIALAVVLIGVGWFTAVALIDQAGALSANLDKAIEDIKGWLENTPVNEQMANQVRDATGDLGSSLTGGIADQAFSLIGSAFGFITGAILGTIVFYYLLKDGQLLFRRWVERQDDPEAAALYHQIGDRTVSNTQSYFRGRTIMAVVNGATMGLAVYFLGVPAAGAIAVVNVIGAYIPYLGAFIGGAFAVLMALGEGGIALALIVLAISLGVNLLLENLLEPVLLGGSLNLHPLTILLVTSLGGIMAGMIGLILAAPAVAILVDIKRELKVSGFFNESTG